MRILYLKNYRKGPATNSSSTHSVIFKNKDDMFKDMNVFEENFYDRYTETLAVSKSAKIKYIAANIMYYKPLYDTMCLIYPEMEQYRELIKETINDEEEKYPYSFGMYARGRLYFRDNLEASIGYLRNIIENDDIIIVGGSDEEEFVYDTIEDHKKIELPDYLAKFFGSVKNGNYWVGYKFGRKIRFSTNRDICVPEYPELIDLSITDKCEHGCPFCYKDASKSGEHANIDYVKNLIRNVNAGYPISETHYKKKIEFAIGGGNILLYPNLGDLFDFITHEGHIVNVTLNAKDYPCLFDEKKNKGIKEIFDKYVTSVGVSVTSMEDVELLKKYGYWIPARYKNDYDSRPASVVIHLIPEMLGAEKTNEIINELRDEKMELCFWNILCLGYKTNGRGGNYPYKELTDKELNKIFQNRYSINIDTTFANRYIDWLKDNYETENTLTLLEGEYSMYIDAVKMLAYKSSYMLDKPYNVAPYHADEFRDRKMKRLSIIEAFGRIREDNGLEVYKEW